MSSDLQSFLDAVPVAQGPGPRNSGAGGAQAIQGVDNLLRAKQNLDATRERKREERAKAQTQSDVAQAYLFDEEMKRKEPLMEAMQSGYLSGAEAQLLNTDEKGAIDALNQASAKGMSHSIRNSLERSVRFQFAAMKNPAAAKELASAYGIGDSSLERDTLASLEKVERQQLEEDADYIRGLAEAEGYTDFLDKGNEDVLDMWEDSPAAQRDRRIKQNTRIALDQTQDIEARRPAASKAIALAGSQSFKELDRVQSQYAATRGTLNTGTDGTTLSLAEELNLSAESMIADMRRNFPDFPKLVETYANGVRQSVTARLTAKTTGLSQGKAEFSAQVLRPMELEQKKLALVNAQLENTNNATRNLENVMDVGNRIYRDMQQMAELKDDPTIRGNVRDYLESPEAMERVAILKAGAQKANSIAQELLNPGQAGRKRAANDAVATLSIVANMGVEGNQAEFKAVVNQIASSWDLLEGSPEIESSMLQLAQDPAFVKQAQGSPLVRKIAAPYAEGVKAKVIQSLQSTNNLINRDRVMTTTFGGLPWKKFGEVTVLDPISTNKNGLPQLKIIDSVYKELSTAEKARYDIHLNKYNTGLLQSQDPKEYQLLMGLQGSTSLANALGLVIGTDEGISLEGLDPNRESDLSPVENEYAEARRGSN